MCQNPFTFLFYYCNGSGLNGSMSRVVLSSYGHVIKVNFKSDKVNFT